MRNATQGAPRRGIARPQHGNWTRRWRLSLPLAAAVLLSHWLGSAEVENPRQKAEELLSRTEAQPVPGSQEATQRARGLLLRADADKTPKDARQALERAALEWAQLSHAWKLNLTAEEEASAQESKVSKLRKDLRGARALLEETEARRSRAEGLLLDHGGARAVKATTAPSATPASTGKEPK